MTLQEKYEETCLRLFNAEQYIKEAGGFLQAPKHWVNEYQKLAEETLIYEIDNDLLPTLPQDIVSNENP